MSRNNFLLDLILRLSAESGDPLDLYDLVYELNDILIVVSLVGFLIAIIQCFFGFKLMKFWIAVQGFLIGGLIGFFLGAFITHGKFASLIFALLGAIGGAIIAYFLYKVGVFLKAFGLTFIIIAAIMVLLGIFSLAIPLGILIGIAAGIISVIFIQPIFILTTSISGGMSAGSFMATILNTNSAVGILLGIILAGLGIFVQIKMNHGFFGGKNKKAELYPNNNYPSDPNSYSYSPVSPVQNYTAASSSSIPVAPIPEQQVKNPPSFCSNCGKKNEEETKFCIYCGNQLIS